MQLERAQTIANEIVEKLKPCCERIEIAGSIRRKKSWVRDIDIVVIPSNQGQLAYQLQQLGRIVKNGPKIIRIDMPAPRDIPLDVYVATPETWATLLLIRTGSEKHNRMLCMRAMTMGMKLHADGSGLFRLGGMVAVEGAADGSFDETLITNESEEAIFQALGMKYRRPEMRE
ncbi:MAG: hypothetical protein PHI12_11375 [Dehalococcoidales bacterium]|nr:hypothetical protein [Dehalococcoidales bacterium]